MKETIAVGLLASLGFSIANGCSSHDRSFSHGGGEPGASGASDGTSGSNGNDAGKPSGGHAGVRDNSNAGAGALIGAGAGGTGGEAGDPGGGASPGTGGITGAAGGKAVAGSAGTGGGSGCATACASYQFCSNSKCLPTYVSTRVLPTTDQTSGLGQVNSAIVLTNKSQGDLIVQFSDSSTELLLSEPGASMLTYLAGSGYAHFTADGKLSWSRSREIVAGSTNIGRESAIALVPPTDFAVSYVKYEPPTGPVAGRYFFRLARVNGNSGNLTFEAKYPNTTNASGSNLLIIPRSTQSDYLTFDPAVSRQVPNESCRVLDSGTAASVTCTASSSYAIGGASGADGKTAWIWGAPGATGSLALDPFSSTQWAFTANPFQNGGEDAFILGISDTSTSVGPWTTEGDYGPTLGLAVLPQGDLAVTAWANGYMTFNGGQSLLDQSGSVLVRVDVNNGRIVWRAALMQTPSAVIAAPGGRIAVLSDPAASDPSVQLFDAASGAFLSTLPVPAALHPVLAAGQTDLFVLGDYSSAVDFDPGAGTDKPSSNRGVFISRYSF